MGDIAELVNKYGFPVVMAVGMGFIIKYVWVWATTEVKPVISDANTVLIALIDRIRMLDNDLIRLNQKVNTVLHLRGKTIEFERVEAEAEINQKVMKKEKSEERVRSVSLPEISPFRKVVPSRIRMGYSAITENRFGARSVLKIPPRAPPTDIQR